MLSYLPVYCCGSAYCSCCFSGCSSWFSAAAVAAIVIAGFAAAVVVFAATEAVAASVAAITIAAFAAFGAAAAIAAAASTAARVVVAAAIVTTAFAAAVAVVYLALAAFIIRISLFATPSNSPSLVLPAPGPGVRDLHGVPPRMRAAPVRPPLHLRAVRADARLQEGRLPNVQDGPEGRGGVLQVMMCCSLVFQENRIKNKY